MQTEAELKKKNEFFDEMHSHSQQQDSVNFQKAVHDNQDISMERYGEKSIQCIWNPLHANFCTFADA